MEPEPRTEAEGWLNEERPACFWDRLDANIQSAEVLRLGPGDLLMLRVDGHLTQEMAERIKLAFEGKLGTGTVIVVDGSISASVIHPDAA